MYPAHEGGRYNVFRINFQYYVHETKNFQQDRDK